MSSEFIEVKEKVKLAIHKLIHKDKYLLKNDANELTLSSALFCYLKKQFSEYDVDCEYNRRQNGESKRLNVSRYRNKNDSLVTPDIIVHTRNSTENNYLVIEVKKTNNSDREIFYDEEKLKEFTSVEDKETESTMFGYSFGLAIIFRSEENNCLKYPILKWFIEGTMVEVENQ